MQTSTEIKAIAAALVGFHKEVGKIRKDAKNPFFKSSYASLSGILETIAEPLINNGLSICQFPEGDNGLTTRLIHSSGEWMEATYFMKPVKDTPQDRGSAITYQRRYAVGAILSLNIDDDDDGNSASGRMANNGAHRFDKPLPKPSVKDAANQNEDIKQAVKTLATLTSISALTNFYNMQPAHVKGNESFNIHAKSRKEQLMSQPA